MRRALLCVAVLATGAVGAGAQVVVQLRDAGPGVGPDILSGALAAPHSVIEPGTSPRTIPPDSTVSRTVISLGRNVIVEGTVHGDVIVVGADLYMHPGGRIDGRAIAMGGGVYESMLAHTGAVMAFRNFTYDIVPVAGGYALTYRSLTEERPHTVELPGFQGVRIPTYDRINGLSLAVGPLFSPPNTPIQIEPLLTYRSNLGKVDPSASVRVALDRRTTIRLEGGRGTFTNDDWIWSDLINSAEFFLLGDDTRNYYRATQGKLTIMRQWESPTFTVEPYAGARVEKATSLGRDSDATTAPWTVLGRHDADDARRPNPRIDDGTISSLVAGAQMTWAAGELTAKARIGGELGSISQDLQPSCIGPARCTPSSFAQATIDGTITFPTFGAQTLRVDGHAVLTNSAKTPRQRYAYLGGPGTIRTLELLEQGGDELFFLDSRYEIPITQVKLPFFGPPIVTLREALGGAAVGRFPTLVQESAVRVAAGFVYVEFAVDPVHRHGTTGFGFTLAR